MARVTVTVTSSLRNRMDSAIAPDHRIVAPLQRAAAEREDSSSVCVHLWLESRAEKTKVSYRMDSAIAPDRRGSTAAEA